jgi:hypothetical protein
MRMGHPHRGLCTFYKPDAAFHQWWVDRSANVQMFVFVGQTASGQHAVCIVSGHDCLAAGSVSRAVHDQNRVGLSAPAMAHPARNAVTEKIVSNARVFCHDEDQPGATPLPSRTECNAAHRSVANECSRRQVLIARLCHHARSSAPSHDPSLRFSVQKATQCIKGGFSYRLKKELGYQGEVWERSGSADFLTYGYGSNKAFSSTANTSFAIRSKPDWSKLPSNIPTAFPTWLRKKRRG